MPTLIQNASTGRRFATWHEAQVSIHGLLMLSGRERSP